MKILGNLAAVAGARRLRGRAAGARAGRFFADSLFRAPSESIDAEQVFAVNDGDEALPRHGDRRT